MFNIDDCQVGFGRQIGSTTLTVNQGRVRCTRESFDIVTVEKDLLTHGFPDIFGDRVWYQSASVITVYSI